MQLRIHVQHNLYNSKVDFTYHFSHEEYEKVYNNKYAVCVPFSM